MAGRAGRTYKRDARGRFASTGGGGGGSKKKPPKTTSARGRAQANQRQANAALKSATKAGVSARKAAKSALIAKAARDYYRRTETGTKRSPTKAAKVAKPKVAAKMSKAPANKAKANYQAARSAARAAKMYAGGRTSTKGLGKRTDEGAKRIRASVKIAQAAAAKVRRMESRRKA
jgi:hypothetical protein